MKKLFLGIGALGVLMLCLSGCKEHTTPVKKETIRTNSPDLEEDEIIEEEDLVVDMTPTTSISNQQSINQRPIQPIPQKLNQSPVQQPNQRINQNPIITPVKPYNEDKNRIPNSNLR